MPIEQFVSTGNEWERKYRYSRAVRAGGLVLTTGTVAIDGEGNPVAPGDGFAQALRCLQIIDGAIRQLGASKADILRTRFYVTDISRADEFGRAHAEYFGGLHRAGGPCLTMVGVKELIDPVFLVEIEAEAYVASDTD